MRVVDLHPPDVQQPSDDGGAPAARLRVVVVMVMSGSWFAVPGGARGGMSRTLGTGEVAGHHHLM